LTHDLHLTSLTIHKSREIVPGKIGMSEKNNKKFIAANRGALGSDGVTTRTWFYGDQESGLLDRKTLHALACWTGYRLERVAWPQDGGRTLSQYLKAVSEVMYCERFGECFSQIYEGTVRRVRDRPLFEYRVVLHALRMRV
jgi:hypothetical protein